MFYTPAKDKDYYRPTVQGKAQKEWRCFYVNPGVVTDKSDVQKKIRFF